MVLPVLLLLIGGIITYATVLGIYHGVQELASEAARASIAGLSDQERSQLATAYVQANAGSYAFIDPSKVAVVSQSSGNPATAYQVTVSYDMSSSFIYQFSKILPLPSSAVQRTAVIRVGGY
jgi:Flp pilus assembly protein TadG